MISLNAATDLLSRLVACPSVNPGQGAFSWPPAGEAALAALLEELLRGWGAETRLIEVEPGRPNLLARFDGCARDRSLLLEAHLDTVPAQGMTIPPFAPAVRDGRLHGRGACDTKGSMAAMLLAIGDVIEHGGRPPVTLWFASTCNEELGGTGIRALLDGGFRAGAAVVGEPTGLRIVHAHKGALRLVLETEGVAAHGSTPERGRNAIYAMRRVLEHIEDDVAPALERARHPRLGPATINVGTILGGIQPNVVPARCRIEVDRRFLPGEREADMVRQAVGGLDVRHEVSHLYPPLDLDTAHPLARAAADACREALGHDDGFDVAPYATNAGFLDAAGVPALVFGPGSIAQAHADDEWVDLDEVVDAARVYAALIRGAGRWLGR